MFKPIKPLTVAITLVCSATSQSFEFYAGPIEGSFDSQLSLGSSWRMEEQNDRLLPDGDGNGDDGNANFSEGDTFSQIFKGSHDLQVNYQNYGGFIRTKYWYDTALKNNDVNRGHSPTAASGSNSDTPLSVDHAGESRLDDSEFDDLSKFKGFAVLDAFIFGEFDISGSALDIRLGKQVVSWGESTFISQGISSVNPIDMNAFTRPGAEIKEGLLPVNMAYANLGASDNVSVEAFYQLEFQETVIPGCGTYFAINDYAPEGCNTISINSGEASISRDNDGKRLAKDDGQFGIALRYFSELLGNTEFGFYLMNIHNRMPVISGVSNDIDEVAIGQQAAAAWLIGNAVNPLNPTVQELVAAQQVGANAGSIALLNDTKYFSEYTEDMRLYGVSFSTNIGTWVFSGEVSLKEDTPLQINATQLLAATIYGGTASLESLELHAPELDEDVQAVGEGGYIQGYRMFDVAQAQLTGIKTFDQVIGASQLTFVGEVGLVQVQGLKEGAGEIRYGRPPVFDSPDNTDGFVTSESWGYRMRLTADYNDVFSGTNLSPVIAYSHDVEGYAPQPNGSFIEGQKSLEVTVKANYSNTYNASIGYTIFWGGDYSLIEDRDFAAVSLGMQF